jgi:NAD(P)-dependent dehydrogenase (short-subunit alcohol dehydrogenase family)
MKVAVITGGSRGIGAATARLAGQHGYAVCVNYRQDRAAAEQVVAEILRGGGKAIAVQADMRSEPDIVAMFAAVDAQLGRVTALVNNAGIVAEGRRVDGFDIERLNRMFAINSIAPFVCAREAIRRMSTRYGGQGGAIVNVSSAASRLGSPGEYVDYAASKAAVDTMTLGLAKEVATEGIRVNAVRPGIVHTDIHASGGQPDRPQRFKDVIPMKRAGEPEEIARAILWLLSDEASYTTGALVDVSGGR